MNILILQGGDSAEREVSLKSSASVTQALRDLGHDIKAYDTQDGLQGMQPLLKQVDVVFPVLHGAGGEDGTLQQFLEDNHAAYVGSGPEASKNCFDKVVTKHIFAENGIPTPRWEEVDREGFKKSALIKKPYVLKPRASGSSIDTFIVRDPAKDTPDLSVFEKYETMLLEELIAGTELTVGVLGDDTLPVVEIVPPKNGEFDYENKYNGKTQEFCPARSVSVALQDEARSLAAVVHHALGARHLSRVDIMMSTSGEFYVLELNTLPGFTSESLLPKAAAADGISMTELVQRLCDMALKKDELLTNIKKV